MLKTKIKEDTLISNNTEIKSQYIDADKLLRYALGIQICCDGEYGQVFYNPKENHVFVCLGDYDNEDKINVTIENECYPNIDDESGWLMFNGKDSFIQAHAI